MMTVKVKIFIFVGVLVAGGAILEAATGFVRDILASA